MQRAPAFPLNDGNSIPQLGFGVWRLPEDDTPRVVNAAIDAGYRHIDTAQGYHNEAGVGRAIREASVPRNELFVTSKLRNSHQGYDSALRSLDESLARLQLDYLDLFLIHWPAPEHDRYADTWKALVEARSQGKVKSIGVSNFLPEHINRVMDETGIVPAVNQIELHPDYQQRDIRDYHLDHNILIECYSPLGGNGSKLLESPLLRQIGDRHGKTPAQVMIRWHLQQGLVPLPKSSNPDRAAENFDVWDFELSAGEAEKIDELDRSDGKTLPQPNENNQLF